MVSPQQKQRLQLDSPGRPASPPWLLPGTAAEPVATQGASPGTGSPLGDSSIWEGAGVSSVWQRLSVACLGIVALVCVHHLLHQLRSIFLPFFLSGFIVFALQPSVEMTFRFLAGLAPPYRWLGCCLRRRSRNTRQLGGFDNCCLTRRDQEALLEQEPLLDQVPTLTAMLCEATCRFLAVCLALLCMMCVVSLFLLLLGHGAMHMKEHWNSYQDGLQRQQRIFDRAIHSASKELGMSFDKRLKDAYDEILDEAQGLVWEVANQLIHGFSEGISQSLIVLLYVLFWLMQPLPIGDAASSVVRSYLWKKSLVSFLYGACVTVLFLALSVDLAVFFGVISFCLNFVPEVGAFISMVLPMPVIILDGRLKHPMATLLAASLGQVLLKFVFGNILEVKLIERDREMNIHPVWIILGLTYFCYTWGPLGALMSVPMLAMVKSGVLAFRGEDTDTEAEALVPVLAETFLACFEGRVAVWARKKRAQSSPDVDTK